MVVTVQGMVKNVFKIQLYCQVTERTGKQSLECSMPKSYML
jgi:hypothetical protein